MKKLVLISILFVTQIVNVFACNIIAASSYRLNKFKDGFDRKTARAFRHMVTSGGEFGHDADDGFGAIWYYEDGRFANTVRENNQDLDYFYPEDLTSSNPGLFMGHTRKGNCGPEGIVDPHPFKMNLGGITYSLIHNGTFHDDLEVYNQLYNIGWFNDHPAQYTGDDMVDSEMMFHWIMYNIVNNDYNIIEGLKDAMPLLTDDETNTLNFIFTDGIELYAYRNVNVYSTDLDHHNLYFTKDATYQIVEDDVVKTLFTPNLVMKEPYENHYTGGLPFEMQPLGNDQLVYLPLAGRKIVFNSFSQPEWNAKYIVNTKGYNWESYPIVPNTPGNGYNTIYNTVFGPYFYRQGDISNPNDVGTIIYDIDNNYVPSTYPNYLFNGYDRPISPLTGAKVPFAQKFESVMGENENSWDYAFTLNGELQDLESAGQNFVAGQKYWLGYYLLQSQTAKQAFGEAYSKIDYLKAQNGFMILSDSRAAEPPVVMTTLEGMMFGKMYEVVFTEDIYDFKFKVSRKPLVLGGISRKTTFFTATEKADYLPLVIESNSRNSNWFEVGAFLGEECVGASSVTEYPIAMQLYVDEDDDLSQLTFQVIENSRSKSVKSLTAQYFNFETEKYQPLSTRMGNRGYANISLDDENSQVVELEPKIRTNSYPNPIVSNSSRTSGTKISYTLPKATHTSIDIYNLRGQKVKSLYQGQNEMGKHECLWNLTDDKSKKVSNGVYFYKIKTDFDTVSKKILIVK